MRAIAILLLLAVLPTVEAAEQVAHFVEHALSSEVADHSAHHDDAHDEHGCTGLIHLCSCHRTQITAAIAMAESRSIESARAVSLGEPLSLVNLTSPEPAQRPPIS